MDYSLIRDDINNGDVLAFGYVRTSIFSQLISLVTRSRISHVGIAIRFYGRLCVIEALEGHGVRVFPISTLLREGRKIWWYQLRFPHSKLRRFELCEFALRHWGKRFFCSEFVVSALKHAGVEIEVDAASMSPADVIELPCILQRGVLEWTTDSKQPS